MEEKTHKPSGLKHEQDLTQLLDLQEFLETELSAKGDSFQRAFVPLTDGLGLESPQKKEVTFSESPTVPTSPAEKFFDDAIEIRKSPLPGRLVDADEIIEEEVAKSEVTLADVMQSPPSGLRSLEDHETPNPALKKNPVEPTFEPEVKTQRLDQRSPSAPPPLPQPTGFRRMLSGLIDEIFVLTLWLAGWVITCNVLTGFHLGFSTRVLRQMSNPLFLRFGALEFATFWLAYFAIGLGILDMTFGMWVWGMKANYGDRRDENHGLRKIMRVIWSFLFFAPIVPLVLLAFRRKGRNLLDTLSGSQVYST